MESDKVDISLKDKSRKPFHILQPAANDNEALVGVNRIIKSTHQLKETKTKLQVIFTKCYKEILQDTNKTTKKDNFKHENKIKKDKAVQTAREEKVKIEVNDLISTDNPSENYWQILAERRKIALENTLAENKRLEQQIETLKENLCVHKEMLDETRTLIEVLQEMIEDNENINNLSEDNIL